MKIVSVVFIIGLSLLSCNTQEDLRTEKVIAKKVELSKDSCRILILNVQTSNDVISYFIWEKYGILVNSHIGDMTTDDSCDYEAMKQLIIENTGESVVNAIIKESKELSKKPPIEGLRYLDNAYSQLLNSRLIDGVGAKVINEENYYQTLDSLVNIIKGETNEGLISFWITVNKIGNLEKVELINEGCKNSIYETLVKTLGNLKWKPAIYNKMPVNYRFRETIYIK